MGAPCSEDHFPCPHFGTKQIALGGEETVTGVHKIGGDGLGDGRERAAEAEAAADERKAAELPREPAAGKLLRDWPPRVCAAAPARTGQRGVGMAKTWPLSRSSRRNAARMIGSRIVLEIGKLVAGAETRAFSIGLPLGGTRIA
jgi:hypothetical protein